jgi:hypothetical protein
VGTNTGKNAPNGTAIGAEQAAAGQSPGESAAKAEGRTSALARQAAEAGSSRRHMLTRAGIVAAATVGGLTLLDQRRAEAADGQAIVIGQGNDGNLTTTLSVTTAGTTLNPLFHVNGTGLSGTSTSMIVDGPGSIAGIALKVNGNSGGTGITTSAANGTSGTVGLALAAGGSNGADAIHAASDKGKAVVASSTTNTAVSGSGKRGGVFSGSAAAIQLTPHAGTHPRHGSRGDFFVDHNTHLWFCRGGTNWVRLA